MDASDASELLALLLQWAGKLQTLTVLRVMVGQDAYAAHAQCETISSKYAGRKRCLITRVYVHTASHYVSQEFYRVGGSSYEQGGKCVKTHVVLRYFARLHDPSEKALCAQL